MNQAVKNNSSTNPMIIGIVVCCLVISIIMLFFAVRMDEEKPIEPTMEPIPEESSKESNEEPNVESNEEPDVESDEESDEEELIPPPPPPPPPSKVAMRYVWFGYDESDWTRPLNIREIEVYSGGVNIVKGFGNEAVESGSGFYHERTFPPKLLFDGGTNTYNLAHSNDAKTNYFKIDLGKDYSVIEKVVVTNRKDCCKDRWAGSYVKLLDNYGNLVKKSKETLSSDKVNAGLIDVQEFTFD